MEFITFAVYSCDVQTKSFTKERSDAACDCKFKFIINVICKVFNDFLFVVFNVFQFS